MAQSEHQQTPSHVQYIPKFNGNVSLASRFSHLFHDKEIIVEREVISTDFEEMKIRSLFEKNGWMGLITNITPAVVEFVREFYCSIPQQNEGNITQFDLTVRGIPFTFSENLIASILQLPRVPNSQYLNTDFDKTLVASTLCGRRHPWDGQKALRQRELLPVYRLINIIFNHNIQPRNHTTALRFNGAKLLYCIVRELSIDFPRIIFHDVLRAANAHHRTKTLPYGSFLTKMAEQLLIPILPDEERQWPMATVSRYTLTRTLRQEEADYLETLATGVPPSGREQGQSSISNVDIVEKVDHQFELFNQKIDYQFDLANQMANHHFTNFNEKIDQMMITMMSSMTAISSRLDHLEEVVQSCNVRLNQMHASSSVPMHVSSSVPVSATSTALVRSNVDIFQY